MLTAFSVLLLSSVSCSDIEILSPPGPKGNDGTNGSEQERTSLSYISSALSGATETFVFKTDANAEVTMNHQSTTVSGTADANGDCSIDFPTLQTEEQPAIAYALAPDKRESFPLSLRVRIDDRASITYDFETVQWFHSDGTTMQSSPANQFTGGGSPSFTITQPTNMQYFTIPFEAVGIKEIHLSFDGGYGQLTAIAIPNAPGDYSSGVIKVQGAGGVGISGTLKLIITAVSFLNVEFTQEITATVNAV